MENKVTPAPKLITMDTSVSLNVGNGCRERLDMSYPEVIEDDEDRSLEFRVSYPVTHNETKDIFWLYGETTLTPFQALELRKALLRWSTKKEFIKTGLNGLENLSLMPEKIFEKDEDGPNVVEALKIRCYRPPTSKEGKPWIAITRLNRSSANMVCDFILRFLVACGYIKDEATSLRETLIEKSEEIRQLIEALSFCRPEVEETHSVKANDLFSEDRFTERA